MEKKAESSDILGRVLIKLLGLGQQSKFCYSAWLNVHLDFVVFCYLYLWCLVDDQFVLIFSIYPFAHFAQNPADCINLPHNVLYPIKSAEIQPQQLSVLHANEICFSTADLYYESVLFFFTCKSDMLTWFPREIRRKHMIRIKHCQYFQSLNMTHLKNWTFSGIQSFQLSFYQEKISAAG